MLIGAVLIETLLNGTLSLNLVGLKLSDSQLGAVRYVLIGALLVGLAVWRPQGLFGRREAKGP